MRNMRKMVPASFHVNELWDKSSMTVKQYVCFLVIPYDFVNRMHSTSFYYKQFVFSFFLVSYVWALSISHVHGSKYYNNNNKTPNWKQTEEPKFGGKWNWKEKSWKKHIRFHFSICWLLGAGCRVPDTRLFVTVLFSVSYNVKLKARFSSKWISHGNDIRFQLNNWLSVSFSCFFLRIIVGFSSFSSCSYFSFLLEIQNNAVQCIQCKLYKSVDYKIIRNTNTIIIIWALWIRLCVWMCECMLCLLVNWLWTP